MPIPRGFIPGSDSDYNSYDQIIIDNIHIDANSISSTNPNGNIEFHPDAEGEVISHKSIDILTGGLKINGTVVINDSRELGNITQANVDNIRIEGNAVSSTNTDGNLEITPDGNGKIKANKSIDITAGSLEINGTEVLNSSRELSNLSQINVDNIIINGNALTTSNLNGNLELSPNGTGKIKSNKAIDITAGGLEINGTEVLNSSRQLNNVTQINIDNIKIDGNAITSTNTDGNIDITPNGNGTVIISKANITGGNLSNTNITIGSDKTLDVSAGSLILANQQISGDKINGGTVNNLAISNLTGPMNGNDQIITNINIDSGSVNGTSIGNDTPSTGKFTELEVDNLKLDGNTLISLDTDGDINLTPNGAGSVVISNIDVTDGIIGSSSISNINDAVNLRHSNSLDHNHSNKDTLDSISSTSKSNYDDAYTHKTTEDAINGIVQCDGSGNYSAVTSISGINISVGAGKTLDVSGGTLTLANDQISGDKINGGTIDSITITSATIGTGTITTGNITTGHITTLNGNMNCNNYDMTNVDINSGAIDGTSIGASSPSSGAFTTINVDNIKIDGNTISSTNTDGNIDLAPNGSGEIAFHSNFRPNISNSYNLGTWTYRWKDIIAQGSINCGLINIANNYIRNGSGATDNIVIWPANGGSCIPYTDNYNDLGASTYRWDDIYATNGTIQTSDGTKKEDISNLELGLKFINKLRPVSYKWKSHEYTEIKKIEHPEEFDKDGNLIKEAYFEEVEELKTINYNRKHTGLISQEIEEVLNKNNIDSNDFAGFVKSPLKDGSFVYGWRPTEFIAPIIKAIQELSIQNQELKERIRVLEDIIK